MRQGCNELNPGIAAHLLNTEYQIPSTEWQTDPASTTTPLSSDGARSFAWPFRWNERIVAEGTAKVCCHFTVTWRQPSFIFTVCCNRSLPLLLLVDIASFSVLASNSCSFFPKCISKGALALTEFVGVARNVSLRHYKYLCVRLFDSSPDVWWN